MSRIAFVVVVMVGLLTLTMDSARAGTDQKTFDKLIAKYAVDVTDGLPSPFKPKAACACTSSLPAQPGFVEILPASAQVYCGVPVFDANGKLQIIVACQQFQVLGK